MYRNLSRFRIPAALVAGVSALAAGSANAALDSSITTALSNAQADGVALGGLVLVLIIAIAAFKFIRRAI